LDQRGEGGAKKKKTGKRFILRKRATIKKDEEKVTGWMKKVS